MHTRSRFYILSLLFLTACAAATPAPPTAAPASPTPIPPTATRLVPATDASSPTPAPTERVVGFVPVAGRPSLIEFYEEG